MIQRFTRERDKEYYNILEIIWLFLISEMLEIFIFFNAYDPSTNTYNYRRIVWIVGIMLFIIEFCALVSITCISMLISLIIG